MRWLALLPILALCACAQAVERKDLAPAIYEVPRETMAQMYCGKNTCEGTTPLALYVPKDWTIYVAPGFDPKDVRQLGVLDHEFQHHLQTMGGFEACSGALERQAYLMQYVWLRSLDLEPEIGVDFPDADTFNAIVSKC